jgi:hypothetical protein
MRYLRCLVHALAPKAMLAGMLLLGGGILVVNRVESRAAIDPTFGLLPKTSHAKSGVHIREIEMGLRESFARKLGPSPGPRVTVPGSTVQATHPPVARTVDVKMPASLPFRRFACPKIPDVIDCAHDRFVGVFTSRKRTTRRVIVDFVPFAYNTDFLEMRVCEHSDLISTMIVYEQDAVFTGRRKPFYFEHLRHHYPDAVYIRDHVPEADSELAIEGNRRGQLMWHIEERFRERSVEVVDRITQRSPDIFVMQNDEDEIIGRSALAHFAWCELKPTVDFVYAPAFVFKGDVRHIHPTRDMKLLPLGPSQEPLGDLRRFLWRAGPTLVRADTWTASTVIRNHSRVHMPPHLGLGAANHFSAPNHPLLRSVRLASTVDAQQGPESVVNVSSLPHLLTTFIQNHLPKTVHQVQYLDPTASTTHAFALVQSALHSKGCLSEHMESLHNETSAAVAHGVSSVALVRAACTHHKTGGLLYSVLDDGSGNSWQLHGGVMGRPIGVPEIWFSAHCQPMNISHGSHPDTNVDVHPQLPQPLSYYGDRLRLVEFVRSPFEMTVSG